MYKSFTCQDFTLCAWKNVSRGEIFLRPAELKFNENETKSNKNEAKFNKKQFSAWVLMERDVYDVFMCSEIKSEQYEIWFNLNGAGFVHACK